MPQNLTTFALIALMGVAFYFLIIRPQRKRQQDQLKTMASLGPGQRVMTGSGIFGTIVSIGPKQAVIEVSPGAEITVLKQAIARVATDDDFDQVDDIDDEEDDFLDEQIAEQDLVVPDTIESITDGDDRKRPGTDTAANKE